MQFYLILTLATAAIAALAAVLFLKTRHVGFPLGIALFYYWSLYGAWSITGAGTGREIGEKYDYLAERMFPIELDEYYMAALALYAGFIILVEMTVLGLVAGRSCVDKRAEGSAIPISHGSFFLLAAISIIGSFGIMAEQLTSAADMNVSAYVVTRGGLGEYHPLFTVHQILNRVAVFALAIGFAVYLTGQHARFLKGSTSRATGIVYAVLLVGVFGFVAMLGNKNELFAALILGGVFYTMNTTQIQWKTAIPIGSVAFLFIGAINFLRSLPMLELLDSETWWEAVAQAPQIRSSGEAFAAHFSLYGVLLFHVPLTYGSSFVALASSIVPRLYWADRPEGTYIYYAQSLGIYEGPTGEAYTVHHATGWYLNFGVWGIIAGAVLLGIVWAYCFRAHVRADTGNRHWSNMLAIIAPAGLVSAIPLLMRAGPDGYKGLMIEAFIIPTVILLFASFPWNARLRLGTRDAIRS